jgi:hypothetical protein
MSELDVIKLHTGLQQEYGLDAGYLSDKSSTSSTFLLAPDGLPINVGWFDNRRKSLVGPSVYALTTYPDSPRNMHHRILLEQMRSATEASLTEEDSADYLDGLDDYPLIFQRYRLRHDQIDETIRKLCIGAYALNASVGIALEQFAWRHSYDISVVREHGLTIVESGDTLGVINEDTLNRYAESDPPTFH